MSGTKWPSEKRIDAISRNGNTGEHYARFTDIASALAEAEYLARLHKEPHCIVDCDGFMIVMRSSDITAKAKVLEKING